MVMFGKCLFTADGCPYANAQTKHTAESVDGDIRPNAQTVRADGTLLVTTLRRQK